METRISATAIDNCIWQIESYLTHKYDITSAAADTYALKWYITTGRAPTEFLKRLINAKPFMIARILHKASTDGKAIDDIKRYLRFD